jgi:hypothetical protein
VELQKRKGVELKEDIYGALGGDLWTPFLSSFKTATFSQNMTLIIG